MEYCEVGSLHAYLVSKKPIFGCGLDLTVPEPLPFRASTVDISTLTYRLKKWAYEVACGMEHISSRNVTEFNTLVLSLALKYFN